MHIVIEIESSVETALRARVIAITEPERTVPFVREFLSESRLVGSEMWLPAEDTTLRRVLSGKHRRM
jgi:hypothetical protein